MIALVAVVINVLIDSMMLDALVWLSLLVSMALQLL